MLLTALLYPQQFIQFKSTHFDDTCLKYENSIKVGLFTFFGGFLFYFFLSEVLIRVHAFALHDILTMVISDSDEVEIQMY